MAFESYRFWRNALGSLLLAIVALLFIAVLQSKYIETLRYTEYNDNCSLQLEGKFIEKEHIVNGRRIEAIRERDVDWCDLAAQQSMAESANLTVWVTFFSAVVSGLSVVLIGYTLYYTRQTLAATLSAVDEAKIANDAAVANVQVARDVGQAQVRAYLGCEIKSGDVAPGKPIRFVVQIVNHGQSPAYNLCIASSVCIRPREWDRKSEPSGDLGDMPHGDIIPPKGSVQTNLRMYPDNILSEDTVQNLRKDVLCIFSSIIIFYEDVFGVKREMQFCFEFSGPDCFAIGTARQNAKGNYDRECRNA